MTTQAGVIFTVSEARASWESAVADLKGCQPRRIDPPNRSDFDIRHSSDVMVIKYGQVVAICNGDIAEPMLRDPALSCERAYRTLGSPRYLQYFLWYDTGNSHGYAIVLNGMRIRTRLDLAARRFTDSGAPLDFERTWLDAPSATRAPDEAANSIQQLFGDPSSSETLEVKTLQDGRWCFVNDLTRTMLQESFYDNIGFQPFQNGTPAHEYEFYKCA